MIRQPWYSSPMFFLTVLGLCRALAPVRDCAGDQDLPVAHSTDLGDRGLADGVPPGLADRTDRFPVPGDAIGVALAALLITQPTHPRHGPHPSRDRALRHTESRGDLDVGMPPGTQLAGLRVQVVLRPRASSGEWRWFTAKQVAQRVVVADADDVFDFVSRLAGATKRNRLLSERGKVSFRSHIQTLVRGADIS